MHWELSEEQELFIASLREWLQERAGSSSGPRLAGHRRLHRRLRAPLPRARAGPGSASTKDVGGQGGGVLELALTARELGRAAAPSAGWLQSAIVVPALADEADAVARRDGIR